MDSAGSTTLKFGTKNKSKNKNDYRGRVINIVNISLIAVTAIHSLSAGLYYEKIEKLKGSSSNSATDLH